MAMRVPSGDQEISSAANARGSVPRPPGTGYTARRARPTQSAGCICVGWPRRENPWAPRPDWAGTDSPDRKASAAVPATAIGEFRPRPPPWEWIGGAVGEADRDTPGSHGRREDRKLSTSRRRPARSPARAVSPGERPGAPASWSINVPGKAVLGPGGFPPGSQPLSVPEAAGPVCAGKLIIVQRGGAWAAPGTTGRRSAAARRADVFQALHQASLGVGSIRGECHGSRRR